MIDKDSIERLKQIVDIVEVVGSYIELRRAGINHMACCPFHDEKTPSFVVSPQRGYFKCYGCGVGGDSISFIMQKEHIEFYEAVEKLADMYNFTLTYTTKRTDSSIHNLLEMIATYYQNLLNSNKEILDYLAKRGIETSSIEKFSIGYSGESSNFIQFLNNKKMPFDKLLDVGIIGKNYNGYFAKFNHRIMFPIYAPNGKVVGFGGRILQGNIAKYINSQQSKIFNKSQLLYGYNLARESIFKEKKIIVTEGYIDTIMMSQAGFSNVVATLGTALTKEHLPLLSKGEVDILLCYDGDNAGKAAALKASMLLKGKSGGVVIFSDNKDPADIVNEGRTNDLINLLNAPIPFIEFAIEQIAQQYDLNNPIQKEKALTNMLTFFSELSPILQDEYRIFIANKLKISPHLVKSKPNKQTTNTMPNSNTNIKDNAQIVEAVLIKSMLENHALIDFSIEYISPKSFKHHSKAFQLLLNGDFEHSELLGILLDSSIITLDIDNFKQQMRLFIINNYTMQLNALKTDKTINYDTKIATLKEIQQKIHLLKNGTLVKL